MSSSAADFEPNSPNQAQTQINSRGADVVPFPPRTRPPRPRRIEVQISARLGRAPIGRSRPLKLTDHDLDWLIAEAVRREQAS
jgi:hypothetical protein